MTTDVETRGDWSDLAELAGAATQAKALYVERSRAPERIAFEMPLPPGMKPPEGPYRRLCRRCCKNADLAAKRGTPHPPIGEISEVESFISQTTKRRIYLGTCAYCTDIEFSENWQSRALAAQKAQNALEVERLQRERQNWLARGRRFFG